MYSSSSQKKNLPPGGKPPEGTVAASDDPKQPSSQSLSSNQGYRIISTSLALAIKKVIADQSSESTPLKNEKEPSGASIEPAPRPSLSERLFAPLEYTPGFEVSYMRTRLGSDSGDESESDDEVPEREYAHRHTTESASTEEVISIREEHPRLEVPLEPQPTPGSVDEEDSESRTGDATTAPLELNDNSPGKNELPTAAAVELDGQPIATRNVVSWTQTCWMRPEDGELSSPDRLSLLLPSTFSGQGQVTCVSKHYLNQNGYWVVWPRACNRTMSTKHGYLKHVREIHLGCKRKKSLTFVRSEESTEIGDKRKQQVKPWVIKFTKEYDENLRLGSHGAPQNVATFAVKGRGETGGHAPYLHLDAEVPTTSTATLPTAGPFIVYGTQDLKRKIKERESKVGTGKKRKKAPAAIEVDAAANEAANERAKKHFACKSGSLLN